MGLWQDFKDTVRSTYVADGVDHINQIQNNSHDLYVSDEGKDYRNHWGTIVLHALGFPTRLLKAKKYKLGENEKLGPTFKNFYRNWFGYNKTSSTPAKVARAILMGLIVNPILLLPRALVGVAKVVTEVIPGTISRFVLNLGEGLVNYGKSRLKRAFADEDSFRDTEKMGTFGNGLTFFLGVLAVGFGGAVWTVGAAVKSIYLALCTLTSPIETV